MRSLLIICGPLLGGCAEIADDLGSCCLGVSRGEVRECVAADLDEGECRTWQCPTTSGAVCVVDGATVVPARDFCELTPDVPDEWCEGGEEHW